MKIFFDIEFSNLSHHPKNSELISLGFISESGKSLYVEVPFNIDEASVFVREIVVPLLNPEKYLKSNDEARQLICDFLSGFNEKVELICDAPSYDWVYINRLITKLPENVCLSSLKMKHIKQEQEYTKKYDELMSSGKFRIHHALDDATLICESYISAKKLSRHS